VQGDAQHARAATEVDALRVGMQVRISARAAPAGAPLARIAW
jgi:hypothetical protein